MSRMLEWGLRAWAVALVAAAAVWVMGPYGFGWLYGGRLDFLGRWVRDGPLEGVLTGPIFGAYLESNGAMESIRDLSEQLTGYDGGEVMGAFADVNVGWSVQVSSMRIRDNLIWVVLHVVPLLVMAGLWWLLAGMVRDSRRGTAFTERNARILVAAGVVVLVGAPLLRVVTWWFYGRVAKDSQIGDRIRVPDFGLDWLPWSVMAAGLALVVLGVVWRRGVRLEHDVSGLV